MNIEAVADHLTTKPRLASTWRPTVGRTAFDSALRQLGYVDFMGGKNRPVTGFAMTAATSSPSAPER